MEITAWNLEKIMLGVLDYFSFCTNLAVPTTLHHYIFKDEQSKQIYINFITYVVEQNAKIKVVWPTDWLNISVHDLSNHLLSKNI